MASNIEVARGKQRYRSQEKGYTGTVRIISIGSAIITIVGIGVAAIVYAASNNSQKGNPNSSMPPFSTLTPTKSTPESSATPKQSAIATATLNPSPSLVPSSSPTISPTLTPTPSPTLDPELEMERIRDSDIISDGVKSICVAHSAIGDQRIEVFFSDGSAYDSKKNIVDASLDPWSPVGFPMFYMKPAKNQMDLIPTEEMQKIFDEKFPGKKYKTFGYDSLVGYVADQLKMTVDESIAYIDSKNIKTYGDLKRFYLELIPKEKRFILPSHEKSFALIEAEMTVYNSNDVNFTKPYNLTEHITSGEYALRDLYKGNAPQTSEEIIENVDLHKGDFEYFKKI
jgi:hypothetical protein